ncbi:AraC family transcriptional regulator [Algibacillus agarilyticus]|uniref:AraC family transcriptional regulator n=1 Tax=Algibacillus agarilyticus TaxID=2234133 RepID=UPI000DCFA072|nr:AraC family transcriptional regulator [Algibacillus agarilyticus]
MFTDVLNIHDDCEEAFLDFTTMAGNGNEFIACAGVSTLRTHYEVGQRENQTSIKDHKKQQIHYILATQSGQGKLRVSSGEYAIEPDSIVIIPAGQAFKYELTGDEWTMCWLLLKDCPAYQFIHDIPAHVFDSNEAKGLHQTMCMLLDVSRTTSLHQADIEIRLIEILRFQVDQALNKNMRLDRQQLKFRHVMHHVYKQLHHPWTVAELAEKMHLSEPHFFRLCQQETKMSPMKLLTKVRLEYACHLLKHTQFNLEQIAASIGYKDGAAFAHRFKKTMGIAPGKWREKAI